MKLTKYTHACFTLENENQIIVVDPGSDSFDLQITDNIVGVLITHEHGDHMSHELITAIRKRNPTACVYGPRSALDAINAPTYAVSDAEVFTVGSFKVKSYAMSHALVHTDIKAVEDIGYYINDTVYYGGDSIVIPDNISPKVLAVPISANWALFADIVEFTRSIKPTYAFPTHDRILSDVGKKVSDNHMKNLTSNYDIHYLRLDPKTPLEI